MLRTYPTQPAAARLKQALSEKFMYQAQWNRIAKDVNFNLEIDHDRFLEKVPRTHRILDFGCGYGRISNILRKSGYRNVIGVDSSSSMIERGKCEFPELDLRVSVEEALPFHDESFDTVVACAVFTCITDYKMRLRQINEICRILRPKGVLHLVEFCSDSSKHFVSSLGVPMLHSEPQEIRELCSILQIVNEEVVKANTMMGGSAKSYRIFAQKSLNKSSKKDELKRIFS